jgi:predicted ester cyclase
MSSLVIEHLFNQVLGGPRDLTVLDELLSPAFVDNSSLPDQPTDRSSVRAKLEALRAGFPDVVFLLDASICEGDIAAARWHWIGTHTGPFAGMPATGRNVAVRGMDFYRVNGDQIVEHWEVVDQAALMTQLQSACSDPPNLSLNPDASPAALTRRPLGAG